MALCTTVKTCQNMVQYIACGYASHNWNLCDAYLDLYSWINNHPQHGYKVQLSTIAKVIVDILKQLNFQMIIYNIIHQLIETKFAHWPGTYPAIAQSKICSMRKLHPKLIAWIYVFKVSTKWNRLVLTSRNIKHSLQQILDEKKQDKCMVHRGGQVI